MDDETLLLSNSNPAELTTATLGLERILSCASCDTKAQDDVHVCGCYRVCYCATCCRELSHCPSCDAPLDRLPSLERLLATNAGGFSVKPRKILGLLQDIVLVLNNDNGLRRVQQKRQRNEQVYCGDDCSSQKECSVSHPISHARYREHDNELKPEHESQEMEASTATSGTFREAQDPDVKERELEVSQLSIRQVENEGKKNGKVNGSISVKRVAESSTSTGFRLGKRRRPTSLSQTCTPPKQHGKKKGDFCRDDLQSHDLIAITLEDRGAPVSELPRSVNTQPSVNRKDNREESAFQGLPEHSLPETLLSLPSTYMLEQHLQTPQSDSQSGVESKITECVADEPIEHHRTATEEYRVVSSVDSNPGSLATLPSTGRFEENLQTLHSARESYEKSQAATNTAMCDQEEVDQKSENNRADESLRLVPTSVMPDQHGHDKLDQPKGTDSALLEARMSALETSVELQRSDSTQTDSLSTLPATYQFAAQLQATDAFSCTHKMLAERANSTQLYADPEMPPSLQSNSGSAEEQPQRSHLAPSFSIPSSCTSASQRSMQRTSSIQSSVLSDSLSNLPSTLDLEIRLQQQVTGTTESQPLISESTQALTALNTCLTLPSTYNLTEQLRRSNSYHNSGHGSCEGRSSLPPVSQLEPSQAHMTIPDSFCTLPSTIQLEQHLLKARSERMLDSWQLQEPKAPNAVKPGSSVEYLEDPPGVRILDQLYSSPTTASQPDQDKLTVALESVSRDLVDVFREIEASGKVRFVPRICRSTIDLKDCTVLPSHFLTNAHEDRTCTRTFEFLKAMALGLNIFALEWITSLDLEEEETINSIWGDSQLFKRAVEVRSVEDSTYSWLKTSSWWDNNKGPCWSSTRRKSQGAMPLLDGFQVHVLSDSSQNVVEHRTLSVDEAELVCLLGGAHSLMSLDEDRSCFERNDGAVILLVSDYTTKDSLLKDMQTGEIALPLGAKLESQTSGINGKRAIVVKELWLIDSIAADTVAPMANYRLGVLSW